MSTPWPKVKLGEVLRRSEESILPDAGTEYPEITVRLWGNGVVERGRALGAAMSGRRYIARTGQFIASRIDARNGATGLVPASLDGALVTNDFPLFILDATRLLPEFFGWLTKTDAFVELCLKASEGTTNRVRLKEDRFLALEIPLPPLAEQQRVMTRIEELAAQIHEAKLLRTEAEQEIDALITAKFRSTLASSGELVRYLPFTEVAMLKRRDVEVDATKTYQEIGVYCFGRGIFHKQPRLGFEVGDKDLIEIHAYDVILQLTFAWEGAVALAEQRDHGLFGSVRYLTFVPKPELCSPRYLHAFTRTPEAIAEFRRISPGSAGRNRVLSVKRLNEVMVPLVPLEKQAWLTDALQTEVDALKRLQAETAAELDALLPAILDRAFKAQL